MSALDLNRRQTLLAGLAGAALPKAAFAAGPTDKRLVIILLRGALDGLSAAPPYGDPDYQRARSGLAVDRPGGGSGAALDLDGFFGLAPELAHVHARFRQGEAIVFHAIASPYRDRSHFDGQNLIETGADRPFILEDGWANRAMAGLPEAAKARRPFLGVALAPATPLMLRGAAAVTSWSPSVLPAPDADLLMRIQALYREADPKLAGALAAAAEANGAAAGGGRADPFVALTTAAARFLKQPDGPRLAMVELSGWDTHANQSGAYGALSRSLRSLDAGLRALTEGLGEDWKDTAVLVMTEFGRTVAMNGTRGTDHGTAGAAFLLGGGLNGGRVIADWPGLRPKDLYAERDLRPTADLRSVVKAVLQSHLGLQTAYVDRVVLPGSAGAAALTGLFKT